jgi:hypothetical protein
MENVLIVGMLVYAGAALAVARYIERGIVRVQ